MLPAYARVGGSLGEMGRYVRLASLEERGEGYIAKLVSEPMCLGCTGDPFFYSEFLAAQSSGLPVRL